MNTSTGANLPAETDGFTLQASSNQQSTLTAYFANKGWTDSSWYTQINSEIAGTAPFFYFVSDGNGNYKLADGFQYGLSNGSIAPLVIDDSYPTGTYTFTGNVNGKPVTVKLIVLTPPSTSQSVSSAGGSIMMANIDNLDSHYSQSTLA